jgi:hypothetical protein
VNDFDTHKLSMYILLILLQITSFRENMKNLKFVSMGLLQRHKRFLMKDGSCKMVHLGLEITSEIIQE